MASSSGAGGQDGTVVTYAYDFITNACTSTTVVTSGGVAGTPTDASVDSSMCCQSAIDAGESTPLSGLLAACQTTTDGTYDVS